MADSYTYDCTSGQTAEAELPPPTLEQARIARWEQVKSIRIGRELGGCATPVGRVQTDERSIAKINGLVTMAMLAQGAGQPFEVAFTMEDNSIVTLDAASAIAMGSATGSFVAAVYAKSFALRAAIEAAADVAAIEAIDIESGWPQ